MSINIEYLAKLSALKVDAHLADSVQEVIDVLKELAKVEEKVNATTNELITSHRRADNNEPTPGAQILLNNAQQKEYNTFCVPKVIDKKMH